MKNKMRLDHLIQELFPHYTRQQIQSWIMQGRVEVEGQIVTKAGTQVTRENKIKTSFVEPLYVSRAGFKLEKALEHFAISVEDLVCLDAGISTGGFTDCLLQKGAKKVYGIDVGYGQVHSKIRNDERVILMERTNLRNLSSVGELIDLATLDLSFISVLKVLDALLSLLKPNGTIIVLIKPQFEARREQVGRGGIIKDPIVHTEVIARIIDGMLAKGLRCTGVTESPLLGATGNKEFLAYFYRVNA